MLINAIIWFVKSHIKKSINYKELERALGLSYRHLREIFKDNTKIPLKKYINMRKISNITFQMETTNKTHLTLATKYSFDSYDTFTRCYKREMNITPILLKRFFCQVDAETMIGEGRY